MLLSFHRGQTSVILRVKILDSSVTTGAGLTGLSSSSSGLLISTIADVESSPTVYTQAGSTIESITTLGTYTAPTATKCRFKEVDATNHPGVYELQLADARFAVSNSRSLLVSISGPTNAAQCDAAIQLTDFNPYDSVRAGLTALPNAAAGVSGGLPELTSALVVPADVQTWGTVVPSSLVSGKVQVDVERWAGNTVATPNTSGVPIVDGTDIIRKGQAAAGGASTITLDSGASATDHLYEGLVVEIISGTGVGQARVITGYVGSTKVATVTPAWTTNPSSSSVFELVPGSVNVDAISTAELNAIADALLDRANGVETSYTVRQALRIILSALGGKLSGSGTVTVKIRDVNDTVDRVTATIDGSNNRTAVVLNTT